MNKNEKDLEQISTTDKLKAFKTLKDAGLRVEMSSSGVPTVICASAGDMSKDLKNVRKILKDLRYNGSFGVRAPRKGDQIMNEEIPKDPEEAAISDSESEDNAIPA